MTIIVYHNGRLACDSLALCGGLRMGTVNKITKISDSYYGFAGDWQEILMVRDWIEQCEIAFACGLKLPLDKPEVSQNLRGIKADVCKREVYTYEDRLVPMMHNPARPIAIGLGWTFALGAIDHGATAAQAVEHVIANYPECGGPVQVIPLW